MVALADVLVEQIAFHAIDNFHLALVSDFLGEGKRLHHAVVGDGHRAVAILFGSPDQRFDRND